MLAVYTYSDATGIQRNAESDAFNFVGTWSSTGTYRATTFDTVNYDNSQFTCIVDNVGYNPQAMPATWSPLILRIPASGSNAPTASDAYALAQEALTVATAGTNLASQAVFMSVLPLSVNNGTVAISQAGTATDGYLTQGNFNTFNNKLTSATQVTVLFAGTTVWTVPTGALWLDVTLIGGGGGGGYGAWSSSGQPSAGAGGGGGGYTRGVFQTSDLGSTAIVIVDAGGTAGSAQNQTPATSAQFTSFGTVLFAGGGGAGQSGAAAGTQATGGTGGTGLYTGGAGGNGATNNNLSGNSGLQSAGLGAGGGGGGGGISAKGQTNGGSAGGNSPIAFNNNPGGAPGKNNGEDGHSGNPISFSGGSDCIKTITGSGGGGGVSSNSGSFAAAGSGGNGGFFGGGGGGGGSDKSSNGNNASAASGGNGAAGIAVIVSHF